MKVVRAETGRGEIHRAGLGFGEIDEFLQGLGRNIRIDDQHQRHRCNRRDAGEVLYRVELQTLFSTPATVCPLEVSMRV